MRVYIYIHMCIHVCRLQVILGATCWSVSRPPVAPSMMFMMNHHRSRSIWSLGGHGIAWETAKPVAPWAPGPPSPSTEPPPLADQLAPAASLLSHQNGVTKSQSFQILADLQFLFPTRTSQKRMVPHHEAFLARKALSGSLSGETMKGSAWLGSSGTISFLSWKQLANIAVSNIWKTIILVDR